MRCKHWLGRSLIVALVVLSLSSAARAQNKGFAVPRLVPTAAGEWSFMVDHPWYSSMRYFAAGFTLDYAHDPLVVEATSASGETSQRSVIEHQLLGHIDLAGSFLDRVMLTAHLPIVLYEQGQPLLGVGPSAAGVGDPDLGFMVRLYGQPYRDAFSIHVGARFWIPVGRADSHAGESGFRALPKLVMGGLSHHVQWSFTGAFWYRPSASIGSQPAGTPGSTVGPEFQLGAAIGYADLERRFQIGPELLVSTVVTDGHAFEKAFTSLEALLGANYNIARQVNVGAAVGLGALTSPGTPDLRVLLRLAYAPIRAEKRAKPAPAPTPPPPPPDRDHDGVVDADDLCPDVAQGEVPDPARRGCPRKDSDGDGVYDDEDACVDVAQGPNPDPTHRGCPRKDSDGDGVWDDEDRCPTVAAGPQPDPEKPGCPAPDRDKDSVADPVDACPDQPGAPSPDPKKNGCPGLVTVREGLIVILQPVFFATNKDVILPKSFPVLRAVADALKAQPQIKKLSIEGHTDSRGSADKNRDLSQRRADSVMKWIVQTGGIDAVRLEAHGYGPDRPIQPNDTAAGRAANRRVEFRIVDPAQNGTEEKK